MLVENKCLCTGVYKLIVSGVSGSKVQRLVTLSVQSEAGSSSEASVEHTPVPVAQFGAHVTDLHANRNKKFKDYYLVSDIQCSVVSVWAGQVCDNNGHTWKLFMTMEPVIQRAHPGPLRIHSA